MGTTTPVAARARTLLPPPREGTFVDEALLEAEFPDVPRLDIGQRLTGEGRALDVREATLDLVVGAGIDRLVARGGYRRLGHSRLKDFAPGRFGFSWGRARELSILTTRLRDLPLLRAAYLGGDVPRSKVRAVIDVATPQTEGGWLVIARRRSIRTLELAVRAFRRNEGAVAEPPEEHSEAPSATCQSRAPPRTSSSSPSRTAGRSTATACSWEGGSVHAC